MALTFSAGTHRVDHGSGSSLDDLGAMTICAWVYRTGNGGNQFVAQKGWTPTSAGVLFMVDNGSGEGEIAFARGGTSFEYALSSPGRVVQNGWTFMAAAASAFATAGGIDLFYGSLSAAAVEEGTYGATIDGSGTYGSDAAAALTVGGDASALNFAGRVAIVKVFNRKLTQAEIQREQFSVLPRGTGCVLCVEYHGTGTQIDRTGTGNNGTITGASASDHPPFEGGHRRPRAVSVPATATTQDIAVTNTALYFSPYNTRSDGGGSYQSNNIYGSSTFARWNSPGAYLDVNVTIAGGGAGLVQLLLDTSILNGLTANRAPILQYGYDNRVPSTSQLAYSASTVALTLASGLSAGTYTFFVEFKAIGLNSPGNRFDPGSTPYNAVEILGLRIDSSASVAAATRPSNGYGVVFSDSTNEGAGLISAGAPSGDVEAVDNDATQTIAFLLRRAFDVDLGNISYGGCGFAKGINNATASASAPSFWSATAANRFGDQIEASVTRLVSGVLSPVPTWCVIMLGANDASIPLTSTLVTNAINGIRPLIGTNCWLFVCADPLPDMPFTELSTGVANATQTARTVYLAPTPLHDPADFPSSRWGADSALGGGHYLAEGHAIIGAELVRLMTDQMESGTGGGGMGAIGTSEIDFGAFPGSTHTMVAVTGQTGILSTSKVEAWLTPAATDDHTADEHIVESAQISVIASDIVAGTGFTIHGLYQPALEEALTAPTPSTFRSVAGTVYGGQQPSIGGVGVRATGKWKVSWVWSD